MDPYPVWKTPPIIEAVLDIRATLPAKVDLTTLETFQHGIETRFPAKQERKTFEFGFEDKGGPEAPQVHAPTGGPDGFLFRAGDEQKIVQARLDGFTFSRLKGYTVWDIFRDEARELWQRYKDVARPESVDRIALRYINRLDLPLPVTDLKQYILTTPEIAPGVPQQLLTYFLRFVISDPNSGALANVIQSADPILMDATILPLVFDIDVFKQKSYDPQSDKIWADFESLRNFKNQIFYNSITEETKKLFEKEREVV